MSILLVILQYAHTVRTWNARTHARTPCLPHPATPNFFPFFTWMREAWVWDAVRSWNPVLVTHTHCHKRTRSDRLSSLSSSFPFLVRISGEVEGRRRLANVTSMEQAASE
ncbi:hypothetical protein EDB89DRAFT_1961171, partial [Lactarius sanguifluus]